MTGRWSVAEDERLREIAARGGRQDAARELGRPINSVKRRAGRLGVRFAMRGLGGHLRGRVARGWTRSEDQRLRMIVGERSYAVIAAQLDRTVNAVTARVQRLGLDPMQGRRTLVEAAALLGVSDMTVANYRSRLSRPWRSGNGARPGMTDDDVALVAREILGNPNTQVTVPAARLRRIADGDI